MIKQACHIESTEKRRKERKKNGMEVPAVQERKKNITEVPAVQKSDREVMYGVLLFS